MRNLSLFFLLLAFTSFKPENKKTSEEMETREKSSEKITTYYFIRHAEKDTSNPGDKDPELRKEGYERAKKWVEVFKAIPFDLVYSSEFKRSMETARPTAKAKGLEVQKYDARNLYDREFREKTKGKTVLVVGHTNTNPGFVNKIIEEEKYEDLPEEESGSLFIVTVHPGGEKTSQVLYIN